MERLGVSLLTSTAVVVAHLPRDFGDSAALVHRWLHALQRLKNLRAHIAVLSELGLGVCMASSRCG